MLLMIDKHSVMRHRRVFLGLVLAVLALAGFFMSQMKFDNTPDVLIAACALYAFSIVGSLSKFGLLVALTMLLGIFIEFFLVPPVLLLYSRLRPLHAPRQSPRSVEA